VDEVTLVTIGQKGGKRRAGKERPRHLPATLSLPRRGALRRCAEGQLNERDTTAVGFDAHRELIFSGGLQQSCGDDDTRIAVRARGRRSSSRMAAFGPRVPTTECRKVAADSTGGWSCRLRAAAIGHLELLSIARAYA